MRSMAMGMLALTLALVFGLSDPALAAAEEKSAAENKRADSEAKQIELRIERARERLDEAARRLAELHTRLWELETTGPRSQKPMLGVLLKDAGSADGLALAGVTPDGGAERAGLKAGDTVVEVNGVRLDGGGGQHALNALTKAMESVSPGDSVPVTYVRDGDTVQTEVVTQARGHHMAKVVEEKGPWLESLRSLGALEHLEALHGLEALDVLDDVTLDLEDHLLRAPAGLRLETVRGTLGEYFGFSDGALVLEVPERESSLRPGDVIAAVDGEPVAGSGDAMRRLAAASGQVPVRIRRSGEDRTIDVDADALNRKTSLQILNATRMIRIDRDDDGEKLRLEIVVDP